MSKSTSPQNTATPRRAQTALASAIAIALYGGAGAAQAQQQSLEP